jgi:N-acetyl-gamma-glutamyl-phosphate reductase
LGEIGEILQALQPNIPEINFLPIRGNFTRGIFASVYTTFDGDVDDAYSLYEQFYANSSFTHISKKALDLKMVVNTNNCLIHLHKHNNLLLITSCLDNLLKGASGQAVENMNLMFSWPQTTGLQLKANVH